MDKILFFVLFFLCGCTTVSEQRGVYLSSFMDVEKKIKKYDTKDAICEKIGYPTVIGSLDPQKWIFIGQKCDVSAIDRVKIT